MMLCFRYVTGYTEDSACVPFDATSQITCADNSYFPGTSSDSDCAIALCDRSLCTSLTPANCKATPENGKFYVSNFDLPKAFSKENQS